MIQLFVSSVALPLQLRRRKSWLTKKFSVKETDYQIRMETVQCSYYLCFSCFFFSWSLMFFSLLPVNGELCSCSLFCSSQLCNKSLFDLCRALHWWLSGGSIPHIPLSAYPGSYANGHQCGNTNPGKFREILSFYLFIFVTEMKVK